MSDRIKGLTVLLRPSMRDDDAEHTINAIKMIKGVERVELHVEDHDHWMVVERAKMTIEEKLWKAIRDEK